MSIYTGQIAFVSVDDPPNVWVFDSEKEADQVESIPLCKPRESKRALHFTRYGLGSFHRVIRSDVAPNENFMRRGSHERVRVL